MDRFEERSSKHITEGKGLITWQKTKQDLRKKVGATEYAKWIDGLRVVADVDGVVMIAARDRLTHDRVQSEYRETLIRSGVLGMRDIGQLGLFVGLTRLPT